MEISPGSTEVKSYLAIEYPGMWQKQEKKREAGMKYLKEYLFGLDTLLSLSSDKNNREINKNIIMSESEKQNIVEEEYEYIYEEEKEGEEIEPIITDLLRKEAGEEVTDIATIMETGINIIPKKSIIILEERKSLDHSVDDYNYKQEQDVPIITKYSSNYIYIYIYIEKEKWKTKQEGRFKFYTSINYLIHPKDGAVLKDKKTISLQRRTGTHLIRKMGANMLKGCSIMNVSLPVRIFQPNSVLHLLADNYTLSPHFLEKGCQLSDPVERLKQVAGFIVATLHTTLLQEKPFNPVLGETFQAQIGSYAVVLEQVAHHPPISAIYLNAPKFYIYGSHELWAKTSPNSCRSGKSGRAHIRIRDKEDTHISFNWPNAFIGVYIYIIYIGSNVGKANLKLR